jgi:glycosyltransferase involved in cell wall biosynthesis
VGQKKLLFASVLKPIDEPRMFERLAGAFKDQEKYTCYFWGNQPSQFKNLRSKQYEVFLLRERLGFKRFVSSFYLLFYLIKIKPHTLCITSHELWIAAIIFKCFGGQNLIYDVQENYSKNASYSIQNALLCRLTITYIRFKEKIIDPFIDHYILAEKIYQFEMPWLRRKSIVLENKMRLLTLAKQEIETANKTHQIIFSGTLSVQTGIFEAIEFMKEMFSKGSLFHCLIIGFAPQKEIAQKIRSLTKDQPRFILTGIEQFVSHSNIQHEIRRSIAGLVFYQSHPGIENKFPSKIFEYQSFGVPIIWNEQGKWTTKMAYQPILKNKILNSNEHSILELLSKKPTNLESLWNESMDEALRNIV